MKWYSFKRIRAVTIGLSLALMFSAAPVPQAKAATPFIDVDSQRYAWAEPSINTMSAKQILVGYPDGTFKPDQPVTKAEWTMMVYRLFDFYRPNQLSYSSKRLPPFQDVPELHWASKPIAEIYDRSFEYGGYGVDDSGQLAFRPDKKLTRLQLANMLYSFFDNKLLNEKLGDKQVCTMLQAYRDIRVEKFTESGVIKQYADSERRYEASGLQHADSNRVYPVLLFEFYNGECDFSVDPLTKIQAKALAHLQYNGILTADEDGYFRPNDPVTRAEAVTILDRIYRYLKKTDALKRFSSLDLDAQGGTAAQPAPNPGQAAPGTNTGQPSSQAPFSYNPTSNVINNPTSATGGTSSSLSVINVRDYFDDKGVITKDIQANGEIETAVIPKDQKYVTIGLKSIDKIDLYIILDGKIAFVKQEELPLTLDVRGITTVGLRTQVRKGTQTVGGTVATLSVQLSQEEPKATKPKK
jgi:hypothetical protein